MTQLLGSGEIVGTLFDKYTVERAKPGQYNYGNIVYFVHGPRTYYTLHWHKNKKTMFLRRKNGNIASLLGNSTFVETPGGGVRSRPYRGY